MLLQTDSEFDSLQQDWCRLAALSKTPSIFQSWNWNRLWWKHYQHLGELQLLIVKINGKVECIAPLYKSHSRFLAVQRVCAIRFLGTGGDTSPDDVDVLYNPAFGHTALDAICHALFEQTDIGLFQFMDMPTTSCFLYRFLTLAEQALLPAAQLYQHERRVMLLPDSMDEYLSQLSRNTRKRTKQRLRTLDSAGNVQFHPCTTDQEVNDTLDDLIRLHHARRGGRDKSDSFQSDSYTQFHLELMQALLPLGELRLMRMQIDNTTIGVEYAFLTDGILSFFQTGFDPDHDWLSPGHVMMLKQIEHAIDSGANEIDLLKGNYAYKHSYAKQRKRSLSINLWRKPAHANIKSIMSSLQQDRLTAPWRELLRVNN